MSGGLQAALDQRISPGNILDKVILAESLKKTEYYNLNSNY